MKELQTSDFCGAMRARMRISDLPLNVEGVWCEVFATAAPGRAALFLDRDGVVVEDTGYLCRVQDVVVIPGAAGVIAAANKRGVAVVLVTNQAGIGRGYYGWGEFRTVQDSIIAALAAEGARLDAVYACGHHPEGIDGFAHPDHPARKPNPGMLLQAARDLALDIKSSWLVGDRAIDVEAAKRAGIAGAMQVATGHGVAEGEQASALATPTFKVCFGRSIADAMTLPIVSPQPVG
jgi:D-glycero-D-manno-heptose 1,7-bisphosphate phosphatase